MIELTSLEVLVLSKFLGPCVWVKGGFISIMLIDENNSYFKPGKGLRKGIPCDPYYLNW
jgi:hypothetical protein